MKAVDLIKNGKDIGTVIKELEKLIPHIHLFIMVKDFKGIEASGRISPLAANILRRMAKVGIRPLLALKNGKFSPAGIKARAKDIPTALFKHFERQIKKLKQEDKKIRAAIVHGDDPEGAQRLKEMIEKEFKNTEVAFINIMDNVLGGPAGPDALVLGWCEI